MLIAVGDEILSGHTADTNSRFLASAAFAAGYPVVWIATVADDPGAISIAVQRALAEPSVSRVVVSGGVGPTPDDRTLEGVAAGLRLPLEENQTALRHVEGIVRRMHAAGWTASPDLGDAHRKMAMLPSGAQVIENRKGTAPLLAYQVGDDRWLFVLPGVPREFVVLVEEELIPRFFAGGTPQHVAEIAFRGVPEADLVPALQRLELEFPDVHVGSYPQSEARQVLIRLSGTAPDQVERATSRLRELHGDQPAD